MATTTKFGYRRWGSNGQLACEYWISDDGTDAPATASSLKFTAGSLSHLHQAKYHPYNNVRTPRRYGHQHRRRSSSTNSNSSSSSSSSNSSRSGDRNSHGRRGDRSQRDPSLLLHTAKSAGDPSSAKSTQKRLFSRRRRHHYQPSISSKSSSPSSISNPSMSLTTHVSMASSPVAEKRKSGFLNRLHHLGHNRRRSSVNELAGADVTPQPLSQQSPPATRTSTAAARPTSRNTTPTLTTTTAAAATAIATATTTTTANEQPGNAAALRPATLNGDADTTHIAPPQIMIRAPTARHDDFEGVHYPDGLNPTPLSPSARSNKGIKWAEDCDATAPRPRRTSSAATHGRRSSIYSKDVDGNFDNVLGVELGVGSKARRLSVALPDDLQVDECSLEEHFNYLQRMKHKEIGQGGAAIVKLMQSKTAGSSSEKVYAVKEFRPRDAAEESEYEYERKIKSEFAISKACDHSNIVKTYRLCHSGDQWYHVMEYCELGDLNDLIAQGNFQRPEDRNCMFKQLVRGVDYLHSRGIAHRDLKSENLLVNKQGCLKIADFGTGEVFCGQHPGVRNCRRQSIIDPNAPTRKCQPGWVGSVPYMAPEIYQRLGKYDPRAVDVWAVAIVYVTLCFGGNPWDFAGQECKNFRIYMSHWEAFFEKYEDHEIRIGRPVPVFGHIGKFAGLDDQETRVMLMGMLHPEPAKRWKIQDVLECKPVEEAPCCQQDGYSDDIKKRQKKSLHNHIPMNMRKKLKP